MTRRPARQLTWAFFDRYEIKATLGWWIRSSRGRPLMTPPALASDRWRPRGTSINRDCADGSVYRAGRASRRRPMAAGAAALNWINHS